MKKLIYISLMGFFLGCSQMTSFKPKEKSSENINYNLVIINTANGEGSLEEGVGYPRIFTIIKRAKKRYGENNVLYLDSGGNFSGTKIAEKTRGSSSVSILNGMGLKGTTLGKGDFKYGLKELENLKEKSNFKIITTNIKKNDGTSFLDSYLIEKIGDKKVGIIGLVSPEFFEELEGNDIEKISIEEPILSAKLVIKKLKKEKIDFIIVLSSLGNDKKTNKEWTNKGLSEAVEGIDLIIDSGKNREMSSQLGKTLIVSSGKKLSSIGIIQINLNAKSRSRDRISYKLIKDKEIDKSKEYEYTYRVYKVKKGDTLYSLAKDNNLKVKEILKVNPKIKDGKTIKIGKEYIIPSFVKNSVKSMKESSTKGGQLLNVTKDKKIESIIKKIN